MLIVETDKGVAIVDRIEDFEAIIEDRGIYEGVETFLRESEDNLRYRLEDVILELEVYEEGLNEQSSVMIDVRDSCDKMIDELEEDKRMNREKMLELLSNICNSINNTF